MKLSIKPNSPKEIDVSEQPGQQLAFDLLLTCIESRAKYILYSRIEPQEKINMIADLREYSEQINLGNITTDAGLRKIHEYITQEGKSITRSDFIFKTTQYLRLQLGAKRWKSLVDSVANGIQVASNVLITKGGLSNLNRELSTPNIDVFESEHWLVIVVLLALEPTYNEMLLGYEVMVAEQHKGSTVSFTTSVKG